MLHKIILPKQTRKQLSKAMRWQFHILMWAAKAHVVSEEECAKWLRHYTAHQANADGIAKWIFGWKDARQSLCKFADDVSVTSDEKIRWIRQRRGEAKRFLNNPWGELEQVDYPSRSATNWKTYAQAFWISFYERFRHKGLPAELLGMQNSNGFAGQDLLNAFLASNTSLCVCAVCDTTAYFTMVQRKDGPEVYTDIDHYLPKSKYPHLSIHPFNLVPLCHNCNSGLKGEHDPLGGEKEPFTGAIGVRHKLEDIWLPYRHESLRQSLYIDVTEQGKELLFGTFALKPSASLPFQLPAVIDVLRRVYQLPDRWRDRMEEIGDKLFRRMRDYSRFYDIAPNERNALDYLDELLFLFDQDDAACEPYAIAMAWLLVYLLNNENFGGLNPLQEEVSNWQQMQQELATAMRNHGKQMRGI